MTTDIARPVAMGLFLNAVPTACRGSGTIEIQLSQIFNELRQIYWVLHE